MNEEDLAYYAAKELEHKAEHQRRQLTELREQGIRIRLRSGVGSVAVNAFGVVTDVRIDSRNAEFIAESTLSDYLVEALRAAETEARNKRDEILAYTKEVH